MLDHLNKILFKANKFQLTICLIVSIQIILAFQGFDVCDEGFSLSFYQQFFANPESVEYNFVYWLSGVIGGLWYLLFEEGGILWFRLLAIIFNTSIFILSYNLLKNAIRKEYVLIGLSMVLFVNHFGYLAFYYNQLSALITVIGASFLIKGISKKSLILIGVAGIIVGINVFSRLPNITLLGWVIIIPFFAYLKGESLKNTIKPILLFILGAFFGVILVLIIMYFTGHLDIMKRASLSIINLSKTEDSGHNLLSMFGTYIYNYKKVFKFFSFITFISIGIVAVENMLKLKKYVKVILYSISFLMFFLIFKKGGIHVLYAMGFIGVFSVLINKQKSIHLRTLALVALLTMVLLPLGSSGGMYDSGYMWVWLSVPFFIDFLFGLGKTNLTIQGKNNKVSIFISQSLMKNIRLVIVLSFFVSKAYSISNEAYFDAGSRFDKIYTIDSKLARNIYTTKERATVVNELLFNLEKYVKPNDYLLAYDCIPMVNFLTKTKPYMYNPWVWIYDEYSFENKIKMAEKDITILPVVVQQKFSTIGGFSLPMLDYMGETKENTFIYNSARTIRMNRFLKRNDYKVVWSNQYFNIYKSNKRNKF